MAAVDKIYVNTYDEYLQFKNWCSEQPPLYDKYGKMVRLVDYVYKYKNPFEGERPVVSLPYYLDAYLIKNCPFDFIQEELMLNYGHWSQERIKSFYNDVINWNGEGKCPYWAKPEDFITLEDGTMTIKGLKRSDYERIKDGELYASQKCDDYEFGRHFKCVKHPKEFYERPFKCGSWFVTVYNDNYTDYMWFHEKNNTWDFASEFIASDGWTSNTAHVKTITALKRNIRKWKLPVGTLVTARGRYMFDDYEFVITK